MKAQVEFEDFIVGFLMFFALASTVFLFINSGAGSGIDFFNTTLYQEEKFQLDFVYLTIYESEQIDATKYAFKPETMELNFSLRRTHLPTGDYMVQYSNMPVKAIIKWQNFTKSQGFTNGTDERIIPYTFRSASGTDEEGQILRGDIVNFSYTFNDSFNDLKIQDCESNIEFDLEIISEYFEETALANNKYSFPVDFCFYNPVDLEIEYACIMNVPSGYDCKEEITFNPDEHYPQLTWENP